MKWFKHDAAAHRDTKLKKLKHKHGIVGYGLYWYCLELIAGNVDKNNITFELEDDADLIALEWGLDRITVNEIMFDMVGLGLFENENNSLTCLKMARRLDDTNSRNPEIQKIIAQFTTETPELASEIPEDTSEKPEDTSDRLDKIRLEEIDTSDSQANTDHKSSRLTKRQHEQIIQLYHEILPELSAVIVSRWHISAHAKQLAARWREDTAFQDMQFWQAFFETVRHNPWWMGIPDKQTGAVWDKCNLAWLVKRSNFDKVLELGVKLDRCA